MAGSRGIKMYGTYALVIGSLNLAGNLALAVFLSQRAASPLKSIIGAGLSVLLIGAGIGVFMLKSWGRVLGLVMAVCALFMTMASLHAMPKAAPVPQHVGFVVGYILSPLVLNVGLLWFFTRPTVVAQFRKP